jgi:hypothetical protein
MKRHGLWLEGAGAAAIVAVVLTLGGCSKRDRHELRGSVADTDSAARASTDTASRMVGPVSGDTSRHPLPAVPRIR